MIVTRLRANSYTSQGLWPCEGPWLSSKGHIMGVQIAIVYFIGRYKGQPYPTCYISSLLISRFFGSFYIGEEGKKSMMDHRWQKRRDSCCIGLYWCLHMIVQHMLDMQALALNGGWKNAFIFSICFKSTKMSDHSVWAFGKNVGFTNILLLGHSWKICSSKKHVYLIIHSSFFVRG